MPLKSSSSNFPKHRSPKHTAPPAPENRARLKNHSSQALPRRPHKSRSPPSLSLTLCIPLCRRSRDITASQPAIYPHRRQEAAQQSSRVWLGRAAGGMRSAGSARASPGASSSASADENSGRPGAAAAGWGLAWKPSPAGPSSSSRPGRACSSSRLSCYPAPASPASTS